MAVRTKDTITKETGRSGRMNSFTRFAADLVRSRSSPNPVQFSFLQIDQEETESGGKKSSIGSLGIRNQAKALLMKGGSHPWASQYPPMAIDMDFLTRNIMELPNIEPIKEDLEMKLVDLEPELSTFSLKNFGNINLMNDGIGKNGKKSQKQNGTKSSKQRMRMSKSRMAQVPIEPPPNDNIALKNMNKSMIFATQSTHSSKGKVGLALSNGILLVEIDAKRLKGRKATDQHRDSMHIQAIPASNRMQAMPLDIGLGEDDIVMNSLPLKARGRSNTVQSAATARSIRSTSGVSINSKASRKNVNVVNLPEVGIGGKRLLEFHLSRLYEIRQKPSKPETFSLVFFAETTTSTAPLTPNNTRRVPPDLDNSTMSIGTHGDGIVPLKLPDFVMLKFTAETAQKAKRWTDAIAAHLQQLCEYCHNLAKNALANVRDENVKQSPAAAAEGSAKGELSARLYVDLCAVGGGFHCAAYLEACGFLSEFLGVHRGVECEVNMWADIAKEIISKEENDSEKLTDTQMEEDSQTGADDIDSSEA